MIFESASAAETSRLGERIGRLLKAGDVVALDGELGVGKTTLVKGIARGLGIRPETVVSPTFVLIGEYAGREKVYHLDWYRLDRVEDADARLATECFESPAVTLVEWASRGFEWLPQDRLDVAMRHAGADRRFISVTGRGPRASTVLGSLGEKKIP